MPPRAAPLDVFQPHCPGLLQLSARPQNTQQTPPTAPRPPATPTPSPLGHARAMHACMHAWHHARSTPGGSVAACAWPGAHPITLSQGQRLQGWCLDPSACERGASDHHIISGPLPPSSRGQESCQAGAPPVQEGLERGGGRGERGVAVGYTAAASQEGIWGTADGRDAGRGGRRGRRRHTTQPRTPVRPPALPPSSCSSAHEHQHSGGRSPIGACWTNKHTRLGRGRPARRPGRPPPAPRARTCMYCLHCSCALTVIEALPRSERSTTSTRNSPPAAGPPPDTCGW